MRNNVFLIYCIVIMLSQLCDIYKTLFLSFVFYYKVDKYLLLLLLLLLLWLLLLLSRVYFITGLWFWSVTHEAPYIFVIEVMCWNGNSSFHIRFLKILWWLVNSFIIDISYSYTWCLSKVYFNEHSLNIYFLQPEWMAPEVLRNEPANEK